MSIEEVKVLICNDSVFVYNATNDLLSREWLQVILNQLCA